MRGIVIRGAYSALWSARCRAAPHPAPDRLIITAAVRQRARADRQLPGVPQHSGGTDERTGNARRLGPGRGAGLRAGRHQGVLRQLLLLGEPPRARGVDALSPSCLQAWALRAPHGVIAAATRRGTSARARLRAGAAPRRRARRYGSRWCAVRPCPPGSRRASSTAAWKRRRGP